MEKTDKSLIDAHRRGDREAFGELVRRYGNGVLGYLVKMSRNREQAEDLFQETFKRVHEKAHTFRGSNFKSWLFRIATHVAIDGIRKQKRLCVVSLSQERDCPNGDCKTLEAGIAAEDAYDPSEQAQRAEQVEKVREAIGTLPARQRATLVLAYYQQLSYREVAATLGCSTGTVKTQMYRALRTLAERLPDVTGIVKCVI